MSYFKNKTVWITGASSGIGKAMAVELAKRGANLVLSSRKRAALDSVAELCDTEVAILPLDLQDHEGLDAIISSHSDLIAQVDILVNNGGISQRSLVKDTSFEVYKKLMDVNYLGSVKLSQAVLPYFLEKNSGHYVVISSMAGKFGVPVRSGYSAAKMALHGFFDALRAELHQTQVAVTIICPGYIRTDISKNALTSDGSAQGTMDQAQANGMDVNVMVRKTLAAVQVKQAEVHIGGFKEVKMAGLMHRLFPGVLRRIIARSRVT